MRLDFLIVMRRAIHATAALAAAALLGLGGAVRAQSLDDAIVRPAPGSAARATATASAGPGAGVVPATRDAAAALPIAPATPETGPTRAQRAQRDVAANREPWSDDTVLGGARPLDDETLSRQRAGAVGMLTMVSAGTTQLWRGGAGGISGVSGSGVTLWDEIGPPTPLPIPVDNSQAAQGNIASYTRK
jgi:hypothetical protein